MRSHKILHAAADAEAEVRAVRRAVSVGLICESNAARDVWPNAVGRTQQHVQSSELKLVDVRGERSGVCGTGEYAVAVGSIVAVINKFDLKVARQRVVENPAVTGRAFDLQIRYSDAVQR